MAKIGLKNTLLIQFKLFIVFILFLSACTIVRKYPKNKPFLAKNNIEVKEGNFTTEERNSLKQRLYSQLDDSAVVKTKQKFFILNYIDHPPAFDTSYASSSTKNMKASLIHLGYYNAKATYKADTVKSGDKQKVNVQYKINSGKQTLIDTVIYFLRKPDLQDLANKNIDKSLLKKDEPVTKAAVLGEISRLVELYRNNGYYKFTADELKVRGDTTIAALTTISDDPFEQLQLLAEAKAKMEKPTIKLAIVLNKPNDSSKIKPYTINNIYIIPDFGSGDSLNSTSLQQTTYNGYIIQYHQKLFDAKFLTENLLLKKDDLYNQEKYYQSLNNFAKKGVWQNTSIQIKEIKDSTNKIDLVVQLIPTMKYSFEAGLEASYSANSNSNSVTTVNAGNLLGLSGNIQILNRNVNKEAIKMTNSIRAGVELNLTNTRNSLGSVINSNEISYNNSIAFPRFIFPANRWNNNKKIINNETVANTNIAFINRINLFNLASVNFGLGYGWISDKQRKWVIKPLNVEYAKLYNETDSFRNTLAAKPFLRYSFNTSLVIGSSISYSSVKINPRFKNKQHSLKINIEESGFPFFPTPINPPIFKKIPFIPILIPLRALGVKNNILRQFAKADIEYIHSKTFPKSAIVLRSFLGVGVSSQKDTSLPFFKQYFAGGANSMRGWPVRGIGRGSQPLTAYSDNVFNDRTGDILFESNLEYRFDIAQIIPNTLILKGVLFTDVGNIWNLRNSKSGGATDSTQFKFGNFYKELGLAAGTGLRLDFNYVILRFDIGFRFKRPELSYVNDGWKSPDIRFNDAFGKLFKKEFREWRYENMNFTIGLSYPF